MELDGETGIFLVSLARSTAEKYIVNGRLDNVSKELKLELLLLSVA